MKLFIVLMTLVCSSAFAEAPTAVIHFPDRTRDFPNGVSETYQATTILEKAGEYTPYVAFYRAFSEAFRKCDSAKMPNATCVMSSSDVFDYPANSITALVIFEALPHNMEYSAQITTSFGYHCPVKRAPYNFSESEAYTGRALATALKFCKNKGGDYCQMTSTYQERTDLPDCVHNPDAIRVDVSGYRLRR